MWCWTPICVGADCPGSCVRRRRAAESPRSEFVRKLCREIIRMQIGGDDLRFGVVKFFKIGDDAAEGGVGRLRFQIADVLADENLVADRKGHGVFQMRAHGQNNFGGRSSERFASVRHRIPHAPN